MSTLRGSALALALALLAGLSPQLAHADSEWDVGEATPKSSKKQPADRSSENFKKTERFLPGEEIVTPTGKTVKVWSTEGPVSVQQAPEPFEDLSERRLPTGTNVVVDETLLNRRRDQLENQRPGQQQRLEGAPTTTNPSRAEPNSNPAQPRGQNLRGD